jgi:hypothetical protein
MYWYGVSTSDPSAYNFENKKRESATTVFLAIVKCMTIGGSRGAASNSHRITVAISSKLSLNLHY